jgi:anti-sigma B factor antagonist
MGRLIEQMGQSVHLHIDQRENEGITILDLKGKMVLGPEDVAVRQRLQELHDAGHTKVAINLKNVSIIDSTALGTLIYCSQQFQGAQGKLVLFNLSTEHARLSDVFKTSTAFEIYPDEISAVNSFFPDRAMQHYDILEFVGELEHERQATDQDASKK